MHTGYKQTRESDRRRGKEKFVSFKYFTRYFKYIY